MSVEVSGISEEKARKKAQKVLTFQIGNLPHIGDPVRIQSDYIFPLYIRRPRVIFDSSRERPIDLDFMSEQRIGTICVDGDSGEVTRTDLPRINRRIRQQKSQVAEAVQQALVRSSAHQFSRLPFPTHRYTPILDILSHLLIEGPIDEDEIHDMSDENSGSYSEYVDQLADVDLVRYRNGQVEADSVLIEIKAEQIPPHESKNSKRLNAALAHFFREGAENTDSIRQILGPYLVLSAYYYRRALDIGSPPSVSEEEFKEEIERFYSGRDELRKKFKVSRYLIQLEEVGILNDDPESEESSWVGDEAIMNNLSESSLMNSVSGMFA